MGFFDFIKSIGSGIGKGLSAISNFIGGAIGKVAHAIPGVSKIIDIVKPIASTVSSLGIPGISNVAGVISRAADYVSPVLGKVQRGTNIAQQIHGQVVQKAGELSKGVQQVLSGAPPQIKQLAVKEMQQVQAPSIPTKITKLPGIPLEPKKPSQMYVRPMRGIAA